MLSVNTTVKFEIPNFMNDIDVSLEVKRDDFNLQIQPLLDRISAPIESALSSANIKKENLFAVEALGGGSRVVSVLNKIQEVLGKEPSRSLNLDEAFAYGSAYMGGLIAASSIPFDLIDASPHPYSLKYNEESTTLFPQFSPIPSSVTIPLSLPLIYFFCQE